MNILELIVETSVFKKDESNKNNIYTSPRSSDDVSKVALKYNEKAMDNIAVDDDDGDDDDDLLNNILDLSDSSISRYARSGMFVYMLVRMNIYI